ncbi:MAG: tetraacyldisaccharide 4'-kinase [Gammaproteobacteria bacterium]|nr:tetraacyldisaccharide 4'-kinase [Gammaproteobacteria bacterium]
MNFVTRYWYQSERKSPFYLRILSQVYSAVSAKRRQAFLRKTKPAYRAPVTVVVVGNITAGGTGKTPLVIYLAQFLKQQGRQPGIISRGYGGKASHYPLEVEATSKADIVGDEPLIISRQTQCPMFVGPDRQADIKTLLVKYPQTDIILCDDGLQHYALDRDIEIVVIDSKRLFGNEKLLPAGPLREPLLRLNEVDVQVCNGIVPSALEAQYSGSVFSMALRPAYVYNLKDRSMTKSLAEFAGQKMHAIAGIGNPQRFFDVLIENGLDIIAHEFSDHHQYKKSDLMFEPDLPVIMTEKDAVKCQQYKMTDCWVSTVDTQLGEGFDKMFLELLKKKELQPGSDTDSDIGSEKN